MRHMAYIVRILLFLNMQNKGEQHKLKQTKKAIDAVSIR